MKMAVAQGSRLRLFLDLNETLIRTGEVAPEVRLREAEELEQFVTLVEKLASALEEVEIVFLTGNSFEYSRRIEEPLGLKNIAGASVVIVSENGLIGRSFREGDLWRLEPTAEYHDCLASFERAVHGSAELRGRFYSQGNEVRHTLKPVANAFTERETAALGVMVRETIPATVGRAFAHRFYLDIDPVSVLENGREVEFTGKSFAVERLAREGPALNLAVGDSASDVPMFDAVNALGGRSFWVANAHDVPERPGVGRLSGRFTAGVVELLAALEVVPPGP